MYHELNFAFHLCIIFIAVFFNSTSILISGGIKVNEKTGDLNHTKMSYTIGASKVRLPNFPEYNERERSFMTLNNGEILSCGEENKLCFVLKDQSWILHSTMNEARIGAVGIQMPNGIYMFGGNKSPNTSEFLPNNSTTWQQAPDIPYFISSLISFGSNLLTRMSMLPLDCNYKVRGHAISKTELILIHEDCIIKGKSYDHHA